MATEEAKPSNPVVIHVSTKSATLPEETDSNTLRLDTFICGQCHKECVDITEFLAHRLQHKSPQDSHRCELCKATCACPDETADHYLQEHKVDVTIHHISLIDKEEVRTETIQVPESVPLSDKNASNQTLVDDEHLENGDDLSKGNDKATADSTEQDGNELDEQDENKEVGRHSEAVQAIKFKLHREEVVGSKFNYGRLIYECIRCDCTWASLDTLISHTQKEHAKTLSTEGQQYTIDDDSESVMTVGEYYASHSKKKVLEQTLSKLRRSAKRKKRDQKVVYACRICQKVFQKARSLRLHTEIHRTEKNYLCDECGKAFKSQTRLNAHRKVHRERLFRCSQCDFQSSVNSAVHAHRQYHHDGCVLYHVCGSAYTDKSTLKKHMQVHSIDRPFACAFEGCTWRFKSQAMCKAHLRAHTTKGKFKCDLCGYMFRHKHHLQRHCTNMHGVNRIVVPSQEIESTV